MHIHKNVMEGLAVGRTNGRTDGMTQLGVKLRPKEGRTDTLNLIFIYDSHWLMESIICSIRFEFSSIFSKCYLVIFLNLFVPKRWTFWEWWKKWLNFIKHATYRQKKLWYLRLKELISHKFTIIRKSVSGLCRLTQKLFDLPPTLYLNFKRKEAKKNVKRA